MNLGVMVCMHRRCPQRLGEVASLPLGTQGGLEPLQKAVGEILSAFQQTVVSVTVDTVNQTPAPHTHTADVG